MKKTTLVAAICTIMCTCVFAQTAVQNDTKTFTFLHFSDAHGTIDARRYASELMNANSDIKFALDGGDMVEADKEEINSEEWNPLSGRFYATLGNHDVIQGAGKDELAAKEYFLDGYIQNDVIWGENGYYYKDFDFSGTTIRLICLNCFEAKLTGKADGSVTMTGTQHQWLADVLKSTSPDSYILIALHSPVGDVNGTVNMNTPNGMTESLISFPLAQQYVKEKFKPGEDDYDLALIPRIVDAYLRRATVTGTFNTGNPGNKFDLDLDFSCVNPAKFLCYLSGHIHFDINDYLTSYPNQLVHAITITNDNRLRTVQLPFLGEFTVNSERAYSNPDLAHNIAIDKIDIDLDARALTISRIGRDSSNDKKIVRTPCTFSFETPVNLNDAEPYTATADNVNTIARYTRNFTKYCWQALYLPFSLKCEDWQDKADIAELTSVTETTDANGIKAELHFTPLTCGYTKPNTPYLIKPKHTGEVTFTSCNTTVVAVPETPGCVTFTCESGNSYRLSGTYTPKADMMDNQCYALCDGQFLLANSEDGTSLPQFSIYLEVLSADGSTATPQLTTNLNDEATGTNAPHTTATQHHNACYNLSGQRLTQPARGLNIVGGRKIVKE